MKGLRVAEFSTEIGLGNPNDDALDVKINRFLEKRGLEASDIIDIKYSASTTVWSGMSYTTSHALVIYKVEV